VSATARKAQNTTVVVGVAISFTNPLAPLFVLAKLQRDDATLHLGQAEPRRANESKSCGVRASRVKKMRPVTKNLAEIAVSRGSLTKISAASNPRNTAPADARYPAYRNALIIRIARSRRLRLLKRKTPGRIGVRGGRFAKLSSRSENMARAYLGLGVTLPTPSFSATPCLSGGVMPVAHPPSLWNEMV